MGEIIKKINLAGVILMAALLANCIGGCSAKNSNLANSPAANADRIKAGDQVKIEYTCYFPDGRMAATTDKETAAFSSIKKADVFVTPADPGPVQVTVGNDAIERMDTMEWAENFDTAIEAYLARDIEGLAYGVENKVKIKAHLQKSVTESERYMKLYRRTVKKRVQQAVATADFKERYGEDIKAGDVFDVDEVPGMAIEIVERDGEELLTALVLKDKGSALAENPWGGRRFSYIDDENYEIVIETEVGHVGRAGGLIGRVVEIQDEYFIIDWGIPFGGETLTCEVTAQKG